MFFSLTPDNIGVKDFQINEENAMTIIFILILCFTSGILIEPLLKYLRKINQRKYNFIILKRDQFLILRKLGYEFSVFYILLRIGITGGIELSSQPFSIILIPSLLAVGMSVILCLLVLTILMKLDLFDRETRMSLAVHFGSVSVGTFTVVLKIVEATGIPFSPFVNSWVTLMELPSIFVGIVVLGGGIKTIKSLFGREKSLIVLPAALVIGMLAGRLIEHLPLYRTFSETLFDIVLAYFLFEMGRHAGDTISHITKLGGQLLVIGIGLPIFGGTLGVALTSILGFEMGDRIIFGALLASASYVAAPTAMKATIATYIDQNVKANLQKAVNVSLTTSLGITLPFNLFVGIRLYMWEANLFDNISLAYVAGLVLAILLLVVITKGKVILSWFNSLAKEIVLKNRKVINQSNE